MSQKKRTSQLNISNPVRFWCTSPFEKKQFYHVVFCKYIVLYYYIHCDTVYVSVLQAAVPLYTIQDLQLPLQIHSTIKYLAPNTQL